MVKVGRMGFTKWAKNVIVESTHQVLRQDDIKENKKESVDSLLALFIVIKGILHILTNYLEKNNVIDIATYKNNPYEMLYHCANIII